MLEAQSCAIGMAQPFRLCWEITHWQASPSEPAVQAANYMAALLDHHYLN